MLEQCRPVPTSVALVGAAELDNEDVKSKQASRAQHQNYIKTQLLISPLSGETPRHPDALEMKY